AVFMGSEATAVATSRDAILRPRRAGIRKIGGAVLPRRAFGWLSGSRRLGIRSAGYTAAVHARSSSPPAKPDAHVDRDGALCRARRLRQRAGAEAAERRSSCAMAQRVAGIWAGAGSHGLVETVRRSRTGWTGRKRAPGQSRRAAGRIEIARGARAG